MFPFSRQGPGFDASGANVDVTGSDGGEQRVIHVREHARGRGGHAVRKVHDPACGMKEADLRDFLVVPPAGRDDEPTDELIGQHVRCDFLIDVGNRLTP